MARRQVSQLHTPVEEKGIGGDEEGIGSLPRKCREDRINLMASAGIEDLGLQPHDASRRFHISRRGLGSDGIGRIGEHSNASCSGHKLAKEFQPLRHQLTTDPIDPCDVTARPTEAGDKAKSDWVFVDTEDNWNRRGCRLCRERRGAGCDDHRNLPANQVGR